MPNPELPRLTVAELADPSQAIQAAAELYGSDAATPVAWCALETLFADREPDYRFWCGAFKEMTADQNARLNS